MKEIKVNRISESISNNSVEEISNLLDTFEKEKLEFVPWPEFPYKPNVAFSIAHNNENIFLKYYVQEKYLRCENNTVNSPVHEDSCVEMFLSFDEGVNYYNFEFNCAGIAKVGYGHSRHSRELLDKNIVLQFRAKSIIISETEKGANWQLTLAIPVSAFGNIPIHKLSGLNCRANFYKCGDLLPEPHFISWSNIESEKPDFHSPEFFGRLIFE
ncbi:MAG: carbohydrate-binding family 9-like protein [Ginsengibacter sp.]